MAMISKAEQYRCFGEKALASAKEATCEEEKAELLKIAKAWFELAEEQSGTAASQINDKNPVTMAVLAQRDIEIRRHNHQIGNRTTPTWFVLYR